RRHRVPREIAPGQDEVAGADGGLVAGGAPPVAAPARPPDQQDPHPGLPEDPERLPLAGAEEWVLVHHLAIRRDAEELAPARRPIVLHLGPDAIRRPRAMDGEALVAQRRREGVEAVAEPPRRAAAERGDGRARPLVRDGRVEAREAPARADPRRRGRAHGATEDDAPAAPLALGGLPSPSGGVADGPSPRARES